MVSLLLCPGCGGGLPTRRGMRRHLESHGWDPPSAFALATAIIRTEPPSVWRCVGCRRRFATVRGLFRHVRVSGHSTGRRPASA